MAERDTAPAENVMMNLPAIPNAEGVSSPILLDEVLMYARQKVAGDKSWLIKLQSFFQSLTEVCRLEIGDTAGWKRWKPALREKTRLDPMSLAACHLRSMMQDDPTVLSEKGRIVLPAPVRQRLKLSPGDDFEVGIEDDETITLRRISHPPNRGLVDLLRACPTPFEIPPRDSDHSVPPA